jgi:hypothetical protein
MFNAAGQMCSGTTFNLEKNYPRDASTRSQTQGLQFALLLGCCCCCWHGAFYQSLHNFDRQLSKYY